MNNEDAVIPVVPPQDAVQDDDKDTPLRLDKSSKAQQALAAKIGWDRVAELCADEVEAHRQARNE